MKSHHVQVVSADQARDIRELLETKGFEMASAPHARFEARAKNVRVTCYESGKLLCQGKGTPAVLTLLRPILAREFAGTADMEGLDEPTIGSDESGKGDFFGSLVVAACFMRPSDVDWVRRLGVRDSKQASGEEIRDVALELMGRLPIAVVELEPKEYNREHQRTGNVNIILGEAHARAIRQLLDHPDGREATRIVVDKFGGEHRVKKPLGDAAKGIKLVQVPKAESNPAVAAASFVARARFVDSLERLAGLAGQRLLPGASAAVDACARRIVREHGPQILSRLAKTHFKTMERVVR